MFQAMSDNFPLFTKTCVARFYPTNAKMSDPSWTEDIHDCRMKLAKLALYFIPVFACYYYFSVIASAVCLFWIRQPPNIAVEDYIARSGLEKEFLEKLNVKDFKIVLLYGERGSGKTSLAEHALKDRRGVMFIRIESDTQREALDEMTSKIARKVDWLRRTSMDSDYLQQTFSWGYFLGLRPVIVISLDAMKSGEVFEGIITKAKTLSYESRGRGAARVVVDISTSRTANEAGTNLKKRRIVGVKVDALDNDQAKKLMKKFIPDTFKDDLQRQELAQKAVMKLDCFPLKLEEAGKYLEKAQPTTAEKFEREIDKFCATERMNALRGWRDFQKNFNERMGVDLKEETYSTLADKLLEGVQDSITVCDILREGVIACNTATNSVVTWNDVDSANAAADNHPFFIDPFSATFRLAGKAVESMLKDKKTKMV